MQLEIKNPYLFFFCSIPFILLIGFIDEQIMSISIHADHYVFSKSDLSYIIAYLFGIVGFGYLIMKICKRKLIKWLNWIHIIVNFLVVLILLILPYFFERNDLAPQDTILVLTALAIIFSQLFYVINIIIAIFRKDISVN